MTCPKSLGPNLQAQPEPCESVVNLGMLLIDAHLLPTHLMAPWHGNTCRFGTAIAPCTACRLSLDKVSVQAAAGGGGGEIGMINQSTM
jgi:hypothetical protein